MDGREMTGDTPTVEGQSAITGAPNTCGWYLCSRTVLPHQKYCSRSHRNMASLRRTNQRRAQERLVAH